MKREYLRIRRINPHIPAIRVYQYLAQFNGVYPWIRPWEEITEEKWEDWLTVLPPEKWKTIDDVNIFRIPERQAGNITRHCAEYQGKYYTANRRTSDSYTALAMEIKLASQKMPEMVGKMIAEIPLERQQEYY